MGIVEQNVGRISVFTEIPQDEKLPNSWWACMSESSGV